MTIKLCGFAVSNYYNKVKLALIEKGIPFEEVLVWGGKDPAFLAKSPYGKVPFIETEQGVITESQAILEYLEATHPANPLLPKDPFAAAKVRELIQYCEFYLEWEARRLYPEAFFGGKVSQDVKDLCEKRLERAIEGFLILANFGPFVAGDTLTMADCAAAIHLPLVGLATRQIYGRDFTADPRIKGYLAMMSERPSIKRIGSDRKANQQLMAERSKS